MNQKASKILHDCYLNMAVSLPLSHVAQIHNCSKQYISQVAKSYGIQVDRQRGTLTAPLTTLSEVFWPRTEGDKNGN